MNGLTCNIKSSGRYERWEEFSTLYRWPKSFEICGCTRPFWEFQRHLVVYNIENEEEILGKGNYCSTLKKKET